jgi:hypothetical protein
MILSSFSTAFAAEPSKYDGNAYESMGYTSTDPDGEFNLAVISNGDVKIYGDTMYIKGSVYSNADIYVGNGQGNKIDGLFISSTEGSLDSGEGTTEDWQCEGYIHVNDDGTRDGINAYSSKPEYAGAIYDDATDFECEYTEAAIPSISNDIGDVEMNVYGSDRANNLPLTISEDTKIGKLKMNGTQNKNSYQPQYGMVIDTTNGDVTVVIDELVNAVNPSIHVVGENNAYIYISNVSNLKDFTLNYDTTEYDENGQYKLDGSTKNTYLYIKGTDVTVTSSNIAAAYINVDADTLTIGGATKVIADIEASAEDFGITGGLTEVTGVVCVPNADSNVWNSGTLYGQLHTNTLTTNGAGRIIYKADEAVAKAEATPAPTAEPTAEPTVEPSEPTAEPTAAPDEVSVLLPKGPAKDYTGFKYAYIFGYEPYNSGDDVVLCMAPKDNMTREQICAMLVRVDDQYNNKVGKVRALEDGIFNDDATPSRWSYNALAAVASTKAFYGKTNLDPAGYVSRGEVARIVAFMLGLNEYDDDDSFFDAYGDENEVYIKIVAHAGFMKGYEDGSFHPSSAITRAEFCSLLNNVIGRTADEGYVLETADGTPITHETYHFTDLSPDEWYYETMLYATSAFDGSYVDLETRTQNIRNKLDGYDAQYDY